MKEQEIFELLRKQEEAMKKPPVYYIHYDNSTKRIMSLRNYLDDSDVHPHFVLKEEDFDVSLTEFNIANYVVDPTEKKLKKLGTELIEVFSIDSFIYEIPKIETIKRITYEEHPFDLLIEQNNPLREFKLKLSKNLRESLALKNIFSQEMFVYVTAINDPNILYKTLKFTFGDVIYNEYYTIPFEDFDGYKSNVFAFRYFEKYLHVDVGYE